MIKWLRSLFLSENGKPSKLRLLYNKPATKSVFASGLCIVGGISVSWVVLLIIALTNENVPIMHAFKGLGIILAGPFASGGIQNISFVIGDMIFESTAILLTGLSVAIAFKTGLFNIGTPGQYLMGAMGAIITALSIPTTPATAFWVWLLALIVGTLCGAVWGLLPGFFKAFLNINEVIVCIMTNWIAANLVSWVFSENSQFVNIAGGKSGYTLPTTANGVATPKLGLDKIFPGSNIDIGIFIAIIIAIGIYILMNKTTLGYELKACGFNKNAAKNSGMNEKRNIMLSMAIAGALSAMGASLYYLNGGAELAWNTYTSLPDNGFNGIPVALLASNNPIGVIFSAIFLRYIDKGGYNLSGFTAYNEYVSDLIIALIIYFSGFAKLIQDILSRKKVAKAIGNAPVVAAVDNTSIQAQNKDAVPAADVSDNKEGVE